jgi:hypothetical protein
LKALASLGNLAKLYLKIKYKRAGDIAQGYSACIAFLMSRIKNKEQA